MNSSLNNWIFLTIIATIIPMVLVLLIQIVPLSTITITTFNFQVWTRITWITLSLLVRMEIQILSTWTTTTTTTFRTQIVLRIWILLQKTAMIQAVEFQISSAIRILHYIRISAGLSLSKMKRGLKYVLTKPWRYWLSRSTNAKRKLRITSSISNIASIFWINPSTRHVY